MLFYGVLAAKLKARALERINAGESDDDALMAIRDEFMLGQAPAGDAGG